MGNARQPNQDPAEEPYVIPGRPRPDSSVWPPAPRSFEPIELGTGKKKATPAGTFSFFLGQFILYGVGFGLCYGGGLGVLLFIVGVIYGLPIGAILGLALGFLDGIALGTRAAILVRRGIPAADVAKNVRTLTPIASAIGGVFLAAVFFAEIMPPDMHGDFFPQDFVAVIWLIAIGASWHAAAIFTKKFAQEYE